MVPGGRWAACSGTVYFWLVGTIGGGGGCKMLMYVNNVS